MIPGTVIPAQTSPLPRREALAFLGIFFVPSVAQAILITVIPLEALRLLGNARAVTFLYIGTGLVAVTGRLGVPILVKLLRRRVVFSIGAILLATSTYLLSLSEIPALAAGLVISSVAFACVEITSQLYLLDHIPRSALKHFEPMRLFAIAGPWTLGPWLGVYLQKTVAFAAPFAITAIAAACLLVLFWSLGLTEVAVATRARRPTMNPIRFLHRFFRQPRLRLAWTLAVARSSWWSLFFLFTPIIAMTTGLGAELGSAIVSIGSGWILLVPFWGWLGRRYGLRRLLQVGYTCAGILSICASLAFHAPWLCASLLALAALATETIDGAGNLLFLRAVHAYERPEMTTVFVSYRDVAQLCPPVVASLMLTLFGLPSVLIAGGLMMLACGVLSGRIPRRL
jgi:MFS transporter, ACDE family, multidrug resistance protein